MKSIDFTKPGGFPLTQDQLGYLQTAYTECLNALAAMGGSGPFVISGCVVTKTQVSGTIFNYSVTTGWICFGGSMLRVPAMTLSGIDESINAAYMLVTPSATSLAFYNGVSQSVILDNSVSIIGQAIGSADDSTHFLLSELGNIRCQQVGLATWTGGFAHTIQLRLNSQARQVLYYAATGSGTFVYSLVNDSVVIGSEVVLMVYTAGITGSIGGVSGPYGATIHEIGNPAFAGNWMMARITYVGNVYGGHNFIANYDVA